MTARGWILVALALVALLAAGAATAAWYWKGKALYTPGSVARLPAAALEPPPAAASAPGFWRVTPAIRLRHFEVGTGPDLLVVHGGPGYAPVAPWRAAELSAARAHWIFYQLRGCGASTHPFDRLPGRNLWGKMQQLESTLGLGAQVADIERVRRLLGRDRLVLVGHSFGALIAALYAAEFPERVRALVLVSPADLVVMPGKGPDLYESVARRLPPSLAADYARYRERTFDFPALFTMDERSLAAFLDEFKRYYGAAAGGSRPAAAAAGAPAAAATGGWMTLGVYLSLGRRHDWSAALKQVRAPVLIVHGALDLQTEAQSRTVASYFSNARVVVVPGAGHFAFDEQPEAFAAAVLGFLDSTS